MKARPSVQSVHKRNHSTLNNHSSLGTQTVRLNATRRDTECLITPSVPKSLHKRTKVHTKDKPSHSRVRSLASNKICVVRGRNNSQDIIPDTTSISIQSACQGKDVNIDTINVIEEDEADVYIDTINVIEKDVYIDTINVIEEDVYIDTINVIEEDIKVLDENSKRESLIDKRSSYIKNSIKYINIRLNNLPTEDREQLSDLSNFMGSCELYINTIHTICEIMDQTLLDSKGFTSPEMYRFMLFVYATSKLCLSLFPYVPKNVKLIY
jgi:hypothetical protein